MSAKVALWGEDGAKAFDDALNAAHVFAQRSGCAPGGDVFQCLADQHNALVIAEMSPAALARKLAALGVEEK